MSNKKYALVVPNNRLLKCWSAYVGNFKLFCIDPETVKLFVVDDFSPKVKENIGLIEREGIPFDYWTVAKQEEFFRQTFGASAEKYWSVIPHRTDACRSFGYLVAGLWGADVIITFDDDNYPILNPNAIYDYIRNHGVVNTTLTSVEVTSNRGWLNTIDMLTREPEKRLFARGFPYGRRSDDLGYTFDSSSGEVAMNVGLWTGNPDVDAITVLSDGSLNGLPRTKTVGLKDKSKLMLSSGTFAPLNTANTAYSDRLLPIVYDTFQGVYVGELKLDRFGDIWSNLFVQKILSRMGKKITIGTPLVEHRREPRNTFGDLQEELWGLIISERLFNFVVSLDLRSTSYTDLYCELAETIRTEFLKEIGYDSLRKYLDRLCASMRLWVELVEKLGIS